MIRDEAQHAAQVAIGDAEGLHLVEVPADAGHRRLRADDLRRALDRQRFQQVVQLILVDDRIVGVDALVLERQQMADDVPQRLRRGASDGLIVSFHPAQ
jgi:hypothetical protein